ncbi:MAG: GTP-binding protein [Promethearchaeota archaeon]
MVDVILQIWDLGGQERFEFMKESYLKGTSVVACVFDLSNPTSFEKLNVFIKEIREIAGPIPILLIGNKKDLESELGEIIPLNQIYDFMRKKEITDFIKTSAKTGEKIDLAFDKMTKMAILDLKNQPKLGQIKPDGSLLFKIVLIGIGGVGKTSIICRYSKGIFPEDYKMTIGVDFLVKKIKIDDEIIPEEVMTQLIQIKEQIKQKYKKQIRKEEISEIEKLSEIEEISKNDKKIPSEEIVDLEELELEEDILDGIDFEKEKQKPILSSEREKTKIETIIEPKPKMPSLPPTDVTPAGPPSPPPKVVAPASPPPPPPKTVAPAKPSPPPSAAPTNTLVDETSQESESLKSEMKKERKSIIKETKKDKEIKETEEYTTKEKVLERKTTVFYRRQMNPFTLNKLSVVLSTVKVYEKLKKLKIEEAERAISDRTLKIKEVSPFIQVEPYFPGCICVPAMIPLDAREEKAVADFQITPLATGTISDAHVRLYYEGKLIDTIPTPTKVVKQTAAKLSGIMAAMMTIFGPLFDQKIGGFLSSIFPNNIWDLIGGLEGFFLILSGISTIFAGLFYMIKRPKDAKPVEANFPELEEFLNKLDDK